ncbi:hypothetical protein MASR2M44_01590 [Bacteroidota bacterium]
MACQQNSQPSKSVPLENKELANDTAHSYTITRASLEDFTRAQKSFIDAIQYDTLNYQKVKGEIKLPLSGKSSEFVRFTDSLVGTDNAAMREFHYQGQLSKIGHYLVLGSFWEHAEFYLINKQNGKSITLWGAPALSPNRKFVANSSALYGLEGEPNGIQIWRIDNSKSESGEALSIQKHLEIDQQMWAPDDFYWESDQSLIVKVAPVESYLNESGQPNEKDFYYLRLLLN